MLIAVAFEIVLNPGFWTEMRESLRIPQGDAPLGEEAIRRLRNRGGGW
jgi:hypothetical protein